MRAGGRDGIDDGGAVSRSAPRARPRLRDHPWLVVATAGLSALEAGVVAATGAPGAAALAPQAAAPTPFDVFHDLRWLLVYHQSWATFALEALVLLSVRSVVVTVLVRSAWPELVARPPWPDELRRTAGFVALVAVLLLPVAVLAFGMAVVALSWLFFVTVPVVLMAALLVHRGAVSPAWWRDRPTVETVWVLLVAFVALTAAGAVLDAAPVAARVPLAGLAGLADAWCWLRLVHAVAGARPPERRRRPFVVVALAGLVALVVGGTAAGFAVSVAVEAGRSPVPPVARQATGTPVLIVKGFNSQWDGVTRRWVRGKHRIRRFSYRGLDTRGQPRPYARGDTHQSVRDLALELGRQVDAFHAVTHEPVGIVAESEGALVALAYVAAAAHAPVQAVVALSPLLTPGRVFYPPVGTSGWGTAAGTVLDGLARALSVVGPVDVTADTALFRSFADEGPALQGLVRCATPGRREFAVLSLDAGVTAPGPVTVGIPHAVVPAFHGGLLGDHTTAALIGDVLDGRPAAGSGFWRGASDVVGALGSAWQAPGLGRGLEPAWRTLPDPGDCDAVRAAIRRWIGPVASPR